MLVKFMPFIIGRKIEMTQQFMENGTIVPVTLVKAESNTVTQVRDLETDGYVAVQVGIEKSNKLNKAETGHTKDLPAVKTLREFCVDSSDLKRGDTISVSDFKPGSIIDVIGCSKGKGFAGVMKRHGFKCGQATHGNKDQQRMGGSIGSQRQGKVMKGKRMGGRMGNTSVTVKNLMVVSVDPEKEVIAIKGALPGARGGLVLIRSRENKNVWQ